MKCYYQIEDGPWVKGEMLTLRGNTEITFHSRNDKGVVENEITLWKPEILIHYSGMHVTGWLSHTCKAGDLGGKFREGENAYQLIRVDVQMRKPKEKDGSGND